MPLVGEMVVVIWVPIDKALNIEELRADRRGLWSKPC